MTKINLLIKNHGIKVAEEIKSTPTIEIATPQVAKTVVNLGFKKNVSAPIKTDIFSGINLRKRDAERAEQKATIAPSRASAERIADHDKALKYITQQIAAETSAVVEVATINIPPAVEDMQWDDSQLAAIEGIAKQKYACLIGAAGTGKTTVTKRVVKELERTTEVIDIRRAKADWDELEAHKTPKELAVAIAFMAFTGRAVQQMKRALPKEYHPNCATIHATLGFKPENYDVSGMMRVRFVPTFNRMYKMPWRVLIIDEAGMVPIDLWNQLLDAVHPDTRIILIGDINQLPPVIGKSVLGYAMTQWPTYELRKIHRQAEGDPIISTAHKILNGMSVTPIPGKIDMLKIDDGSLTARTQIIQLVKQLHRKGEFNEITDAFVVGQNVGNLGQEAFNELLMPYFNPPNKRGNSIVNPRYFVLAGREKVSLASGDKVMLLQNDRSRGLTNGMQGVVESIIPNGSYKGKNAHLGHGAFDATVELDFSDMDADMEVIGEETVDITTENETESERQASHITAVRFFDGSSEGILVEFATVGQYKALRHAYCATCHKYQGSEAKTVIIVVHSSTPMMLFREWFYTAVTRARERVIILYNPAGLRKAIMNQKISGNTLEQKAKAFLNASGKDDGKVPTIPEAQKWESEK